MDDRALAHDSGEDESDASPPGSLELSKDDAFHILQNARRRAILRYLLDRTDATEFQMRDVAEAVAAWENETTTDRLTSDQRQRVYIALYQSHLPKLDNYGIIRYDQGRGIVEPTRLIGVFVPFLDVGLHEDTKHLCVDDAAVPATESGGKGGGAGGDGGGNGPGDGDWHTDDSTGPTNGESDKNHYLSPFKRFFTR